MLSGRAGTDIHDVYIPREWESDLRGDRTDRGRRVGGCDRCFNLPNSPRRRVDHGWNRAGARARIVDTLTAAPVVDTPTQPPRGTGLRSRLGMVHRQRKLRLVSLLGSGEETRSCNRHIPRTAADDRRKKQIAALRASVAVAGAIPDEARPTPLYLLYNGTDSDSRSGNAQLGVTVAKVDAVEELAIRGKFTFDAMCAAGARPWREIVCDRAIGTLAGEKPARDLPARIRGVGRLIPRSDRQDCDVSRNGSALRMKPEYARHVVVIELAANDTGRHPMPELIQVR
jgi:hypothetical protein